MSAKFTPGPWRAVNRDDPVRSYVLTAHQYGVAMEVHGANPGQREANARLIAAAPELYEALKDALHALERGDETEQRRAITTAIDALAKVDA